MELPKEEPQTILSVVTEEVNDMKMDSGNYDRPPSMQHAASLQARMEQELKEVKQAMLRENTAKGARSAGRSEADDKVDETSSEEEAKGDDTSVKRKRLKVGPVPRSILSIHLIFYAVRTIRNVVKRAFESCVQRFFYVPGLCKISERESGRRLRQL